MVFTRWRDCFPSDQEQRFFERVAIEILEQVCLARVKRLQDVIRIECDPHSDDGLILLLTPEAIELRYSVTDWPGPGVPVASSKLWRRMLLEEFDVALLDDWLKQTVADRRATFRRCADCGREFAPEHSLELDGSAYCHGCAENNHGIVF